MKYNSQYRTRKLPKESRTIPLDGSNERGNGLDYHRFYRCWHCGFICDIDRDTLGGSKSLSGVGYEAASSEADPYNNNVGVLGGPDETVVSLALDSAGNPKEVYHTFKPVISGGCPLCGTTNWLGRY